MMKEVWEVDDEQEAEKHIPASLRGDRVQM